METSERIFPEGVQSFEEIRRGGYLYVDKTDLVWRLVREGKYNYLSRPRRFGKSLLLSTMQCYFEGKKELFEGLKIMELEKEWAVHPVIRLDMSIGGETAGDLKDYLSDKFSEYEQEYGIVTSTSISLTVRFKNIVVAAARKTGHPAVVLIDEYDFPLQHSWETPEHEKCTSIYRDVFAVLKSETDNIRFVFITGISRFGENSSINNVTNISFMPKCATLCGMTQAEIEETFALEIERLAEQKGISRDDVMAKKRESYGGYRFSRDEVERVFNPFSVVSALSNADISDYWSDLYVTIILRKLSGGVPARVSECEELGVMDYRIETSFVWPRGVTTYLYMAGYLTIKDCDKEIGVYDLEVPNTETRNALIKA